MNDNESPIQHAGTQAQRFRNQRGVTYVVVMFVIVLMGVSLTVVGKQWTVVKKRDQEAELMFRGTRIKAAIERYAADYEVMKATRPNRYPLSLEQLTQKPKRYLPVVYKDPITGQDFELIKVGAEIRGVKSRSKEQPLEQVKFKNAAAYNQVTFQVDGTAGQPCIPGPNPLNPFAPSNCPPVGTPLSGVAQVPQSPGGTSGFPP